MNNITSTISSITTDIKTIAPFLAGLVLVIIGLMYILAKDPQQKQMYTGWLINVLIGFAIVYLGASIVTWFNGKVSAF